MKCPSRWQILFGLVALLQFGRVSGKEPEKDHALMLQAKVENLIEKILKVIEDYYHQIRTELKCIPDEVPDAIIGTLKKAIDCVDKNERNYDSGHITANAHKKTFLKCFSDAKKEVEETITSIDPNLDYCPENMTEKTYQINVTTTFTKTFHINIKNGLEVMKKKVHLGNEEDICVYNQGEHISGKPNQTAQDDQPKTDFGAEDSSGADENKVKELHPKGHHSKGHESKEHHGKGPESKERPDDGHKSKEHHGKGPESKEEHDKGHEFRPNEEHESKQSPTHGHVSKEHPGKGHEPKEHQSKENHTDTLVEINDSGGNDSSHGAGQQIFGDEDSGLDDRLKELLGYGGASSDDDDKNEYGFPTADEYDEESDSSDAEGEEAGDVNSPDWAQDNDEESDTVGHYPTGPDSEDDHDKGPAQQAEDYEGSQISDDYDSYEDADALDDDADDDEDVNFLHEARPNVNVIADHAAHALQINNKEKDENPFSGHGPVIHDGGNDHLGADHEKFFFPDTTAKSEPTTPPASNPAMASPTKQPFHQDYYADPDTDPEDSAYGNEYYDASEKEDNLGQSPDQSFGEKLAPPRPPALVAQRIQIKPKNHLKHKPKKPSQNSGRHRITLPKTWPKNPQPQLSSPIITSLSQSFLQSDF